ncbi:ribbon-helix-helix domain-containing protein [Qingshengfaniella alkalisoli]|uniref:Ribbon-helix-helix domain-containing protein n=1 Tax=Qingshengfaniella alkalisoli TaxID=2599296 RepID=A0A5B8I6S3_9RHOB|nr:ribbon-helix-helix domain-containing protein [Qingshengfaniella alkalisoli]QDY69179.1 ribbon-helix-helix domain-containing protein [Qingshengfaniella alkalisoli]
MNRRPKKHSLSLRGHQTSVTLEDEFWTAFRDIAKEQGQPINALAAQIDASRGMDMGLATAIRLFVLAYFRDKCDSLSSETR